MLFSTIRNRIAAPLRISRPSRFTPDMRVCAVKGINSASWVPVRARAIHIFLSPAQQSSGLREFRRRAKKAAQNRPSRLPSRPAPESNSVACRLPSVIVPVLSSSSVFTSPAASTARPDIASTLCCTSRSMPAMPIAESRPPIVVGIRHTSSETSTNTVCGDPNKSRTAAA
jgi:hypothetical protein